jgi:hypothetical protein
MAQRIDNASKSQCNLKYDDSETTRIANDIREASRSLLKNVTDMAYDLNLFMSALEEVQVPVKERSLADKLRDWLKYFLRVIVSIVTAVCSPISTHLSRIESPQYLTSAVSTLGKAVAEFCRVDPGAFSECIHLPLARTEAIDSSMQRRSLRASILGKYRTPKRN